MVREHPVDVRSMLEDHHTIFYDRYFRRYFEISEREPMLFEKYRFVPQLINALPHPKLEILETEAYDMPPNFRAKTRIRFGIQYNASFRFEGELTTHMSSMEFRSVSPLSGVVSTTTHVPHFANPFLNGYMRSNCILRQRGYHSLLTMIDEVYDMMKIIMKNPSFALGLYTIVYQEGRLRNEKTEYGKMRGNLSDYYQVVNWAYKVTREKYNLSLRFPPDLVDSIQNVVMSDPGLFENKNN
jgi:hypothetical protein